MKTIPSIISISIVLYSLMILGLFYGIAMGIVSPNDTSLLSESVRAIVGLL